jgi:hypothetical protein
MYPNGESSDGSAPMAPRVRDCTEKKNAQWFQRRECGFEHKVLTTLLVGYFCAKKLRNFLPAPYPLWVWEWLPAEHD